MDYQPLKLSRMQECGSSLLKSLQNDSMVSLDLLVRESIQNSLDAAAGGGAVRVSFDISEHSTDSISSILGGPVARVLREIYGDKRQRLLVIRDTNTQGLTGPLSLSELKPEELHGNFIKLVYEVGRSQDKSDKGGSWGLGKTVYFRAGIGLVIYYSRIKDGKGGHQERLAACLVESERSTTRLQRESQTGIAWWGQGAERPELDPESIATILEKLQVKRFTGAETGTAVVVPFLRSDLGPPAVDDEDAEPQSSAPSAAPWWYRTYADYIAIAVQRWYGVRLNNKRFEGPALEVSVDGRLIGDSAVLPVFRLAQRLYQCCRTSGTSQTVTAVLGESPVPVQVDVYDIAPLRGAFEGTQTAGRVATALVTHEQLGMLAPHNNLPPHVALTGSSLSGATPPIVAFLRGQGMVVRWDVLGESSGWAKGAGTVPDGRYLVAVVVPNGRLPLHGKVIDAIREATNRISTLEGYLRSCEKADHHQWTDPVGVTIVKRMKERVAEKLKQSVPHLTASVPTIQPMLAARTIADRLLPEGFGTDGRDGGRSPDFSPVAPGPGRKRNPPPRLQVQQIRYRDGGLTVDWSVTWSGRASACALRLLVDTEQKPLTRESWENNSNQEGLGPFPLILKRASARLVAAPPKSRHDWTLSAVPLRDLPGVQLNAKGSRLAGGGVVVAEGTLDVDLHQPAGAPIRAAILLEATKTRKA